jgi:ketosteroid isomerase-like protein
MTQDTVSIARAVYEAYVTKDRSAIEALLAEDFHFTSPLDNHLDRATYFERCWPNSRNIREFEFIHTVPSGDQVFVTYEGMNTNGQRFRNTELLTVRGGKVAAAEVYFGWSIPHAAPDGEFVAEA